MRETTDLPVLLGGQPLLGEVPPELFKWPIVTKEDEDAVLDVLRRGAMSGLDVTTQFEKEFAAWQGRKYAVGYCNGTLSLQAAMFACGLGKGDELICPSKTYWASCIQAFNLGATVVFADIEPDSLCIDPKDLERCIGPQTKAIMVVHYLSHPADMDPIMEIADRHGLYVIEDVSHAQGGLYKGRKLGTFGQIAAMSLMSGKSFATGEMGMLVTDDKRLRDRALAYAHYERNNAGFIDTPELQPYYNMPLGGLKGRVNQTCSAMGRVQLKYYDERCAEIRKAMNYFWDELEGTPGIRAHRVRSEGSNMAGWYCAHGHYLADELGGLPGERFCEALRAEGIDTFYGGNYPLHTHRLFYDYDPVHFGAPERTRFAERDVRELDTALTQTLRSEIFAVPWFKKYMPQVIDRYVAAIKRVCANADKLSEGVEPSAEPAGRWFFYADKKPGQK